MTDAYERILCVKNEVFIYKIPPRQSSRGYRAADWKLDQPDWTARLRIVDINGKCIIKLEDKTTGNLFAKAPIDIYPGPSIEAVSDSSRYFVVRIQDEGGRHAFIGIGFADRGDSFDFNVSMQDHFKREKVEDAISKEENNPQPHVDLSFKEGQTIKINFGNKSDEEARPKSKPVLGGSIGILPPPPGGVAPKLAPPSSRTIQQQPQQQQQQSAFSSQPFAQPNQTQQSQTQSNADWGDFSSFSSNSSGTEQSGGNWVQF